MRTTAAVAFVLMLSPGVGHAQDLERARRLYLGADLEGARREARAVLEKNVAEDQAALRLLVVASCRLKDAADARRAYARLTTLNQCLALRACARHGVTLGQGLDTPGCAPYENTPADPVTFEPAALEPPPRDPRRLWRIATWSAGGAALTSLALAIGFAVHTHGLQQDKEALLVRYHSQGASWMVTDDSACAAAAAADARDVVSLCDSGQRYATAANVMYGVTAAFVLLTGYLYYRGYIREDRSVVKVQPSLAARGGGLLVSAALW